MSDSKPTSRRGQPRSTVGFLRRCLDVLAEHDDTRYRQIRQLLLDVPSHCHLDTESFKVAVRGERIVVSRAATTCRAEIETSGRDLLQLADGLVSLPQLLREDRVCLRGDADALLNVSAAVRVFVEAASASGRLQRELETYRTWVLSQRS
jgi:hypothetical protein